MRRERVLDRERHRAHVSGRIGPLRDHASLRIEDGHREVLAFARLLGVRGLVHGRPDLDRDRLNRAPDHAERDRIEPAGGSHWTTSSARARSGGGNVTPRVVGGPTGHRQPISAIRLAYSSTAAVRPGGSTVVDARHSTIAGPLSDVPAASAYRS